MKVHNARYDVKSKRTICLCILHDMDFDDRPEPAIRLEKARRKRGYETASDAAMAFGWKRDTYIQHENGTRGIGRAVDRYAAAYRVSEGWLLTGEGRGPDANNVVPVMGYVGAGAEVEPDFEQVPPEGLDEVELPITLPDDMIAWQVKGDSMLPMFEDGMIIVTFREQQRPVESYFGKRVIVRTTDGRRYVKTLIRGEAGKVSLLSWNAQPIENVAVAWIGEIFTYFPHSAVHHVARKIARQGGVQGQFQLRTG